MRVWDVHPGYLSRQSLLGQHAEIHAVHSIVTGEKTGYSHHPETRRWRDQLAVLEVRHDLTVQEMVLRGLNHASPLGENIPALADHQLALVDPLGRQFSLLEGKYAARRQAGRIPLPRRGSDFWAHHKYAVMARGYQHYREVQAYLRERNSHPLTQEATLVDQVYAQLAGPPLLTGWRNVTHHLWGYLRRSATGGEKEVYLALREEEPHRLLGYLYAVAQRYQVQYLLHSTVFVDCWQAVWPGLPGEVTRWPQGSLPV